LAGVGQTPTVTIAGFQVSRWPLVIPVRERFSVRPGLPGSLPQVTLGEYGTDKLCG